MWEYRRVRPPEECSPATGPMDCSSLMDSGARSPLVDPRTGVGCWVSTAPALEEAGTAPPPVQLDVPVGRSSHLGPIVHSTSFSSPVVIFCVVLVVLGSIFPVRLLAAWEVRIGSSGHPWVE